MEMTGLQIFKYLPGGKKEQYANCKKCSCPTCMAFALKLAKQKIEIDKCPYASDDLKNLYNQSIKHPQKTIIINDLKIGGENVLYRHEKTFINRTTFAVVVDFDKPDSQNLLSRLNNFEIKGVNEKFKVDLIILKNYKGQNIENIKINTITFEDYKKLEITNIINNNFKETKNTLISIRKKAIIDKDENFSNPVAVIIQGKDFLKNCAECSYFVCKYANMIIFEYFDEAMLSTLLTLRQNIYTDPQKPLQVESNLYEFNEPNENSIIFLTTNFALTFFAVANELENLPVSSYLIVIPADGMSVLTAWSAEKFTANVVAKTIEKLNIKNKIKTRKIIIPGLLALIKEDLKDYNPDFDFIVGPNDAASIKEFIKTL